MKKFFFLILSFAFLLSLHAQQTKGVSIAPASQKNADGKTYALICGISKYKNPAIPQLQFADKDAIAFSNYLIASGVDSNNIMLLLNEKATNGEFWADLNFLTDQAKQGDKVYIYFSGHGDVENKTVVKDAYLLPYDAPKCVYPAGAIAVPLLKSWIATLSSNGIQAVFIADACRSGNLAGGREGMEAAASMLKDKWQDEVKMLSCQPGELSLEGKQWGNGRGLFSYELINGLAGLADRNKDGQVTLKELNLYLMEKVSDAASPLPQNPMLFGNMETVLSNVNQDYLSKISVSNSQTFAAVDAKEFDEELFNKLNDSVKYNYRMFKTYIDSGNYYEFIGTTHQIVPCAYYYFLRIPDNFQTHLLVSLMKRDLVTLIMKDATSLLELMLQNRANETTPHNMVRVGMSVNKLREYLGDKKLKSMGFLSKVYFFQSTSLSFSNTKKGLESGIANADSGIMIDPGAPYLYAIRGLLFYKLKKYDAAIKDLQIARNMSPKSEYPYRFLAGVYSRLKQNDSIIIMYQQYLKIEPHSVESYLKLAIVFEDIGQKDSSNYYLNKAVQELSPIAAEEWKSKNYIDIGNLYFSFKKYVKAIEYFKKAEELNPNLSSNMFYDFSCTYSLVNDKPNAIHYLEKSIKVGWKDFDHIQKDTDLDFIRNENEFKSLMKKYFPEHF